MRSLLGAAGSERNKSALSIALALSISLTSIGCEDPIYRNEEPPSETAISYVTIRDARALELLAASGYETIDEVTGLDFSIATVVDHNAGMEEIREARIESLSGFEQFRYLRRLNISGNRVRSLDALTASPDLFYLDVSGNRVQDYSRLGPLPKLQVLIAPDNGIEDVQQFKQIRSLRLIDLSDNRRMRGSVKALADLERLERLDLRGCFSLDARAIGEFEAIRPDVEVMRP